MKDSEFDDPEWADDNGGTQWAFIIVGFAGGLLLGGFLLWSNVFSDSAGESHHVSIAVVDESPGGEAAAQDIADEAATAVDLQVENARLRGQLERERLKQELAQLRGEISNLKKTKPTTRSSARSKPHSTPIPQPDKSQNGDGASSKGARTLAYWNQMNAIFAQEAEMRAVPAGGLKASNAADFLQRRTSAGQFAAQALRGLNKTDVDREVVQLAAEIARWYDQGVTNSSNATGLLGADRKTRQGSRGKQWKSSEKDHNRQVKNINSKGEQVRQRMSKKYGIPFPPMQ